MNLKSGESSIYYKLQNQALSLGEKDVARIFDMVRFDPRLMEVATEFIRDYWWNLNSAVLNKSLKNSKYPYSIRPTISAILKNSTFPNNNIRQQFIEWYESVVSGIKSPPLQLFYFGLSKIGSRSMEREQTEAIPCFLDFNLLAKDIPFNKGLPGTVKTKELLTHVRIDAKEALKSELASKIKHLKIAEKLTNEQIAKRLDMNRSFVSNIMNNRLEHITVDYLLEKTKSL